MQHDIDIMASLKNKFDANGDNGCNPYASCFVDDNFKPPTFSVSRGTYIIYSAIDTIYTLFPYKATSIPTGCSFFIPDGYYLFIPARHWNGYNIQCAIYTGHVSQLKVVVKSFENLPFRVNECEPLCEFMILQLSDIEVYCNV